jgi:hypothetical protein
MKNNTSAGILRFLRGKYTTLTKKTKFEGESTSNPRQNRGIYDLICPTCLRKIPSKLHLKKGGCKWCQK